MTLRTLLSGLFNSSLEGSTRCKKEEILGFAAAVAAATPNDGLRFFANAKVFREIRVPKDTRSHTRFLSTGFALEDLFKYVWLLCRIHTRQSYFEPRGLSTPRKSLQLLGVGKRPFGPTIAVIEGNTAFVLDARAKA